MINLKSFAIFNDLIFCPRIMYKDHIMLIGVNRTKHQFY